MPAKTFFAMIPGILKHAVDTTEHIVNVVMHEDVQSSLKKLKDILQKIPVQVGKFDVVTYNEVIKYFVERQPDNAQVVKGALLMQEDPFGKKLTFVFLDANNEPVLRDGKLPYGKTIITRAIDEALLDFSEGRSLIIFE